MPKRSGRTGRTKKSPSPLNSDLEDEVDKFHKQREKLHLDIEEDALSDATSEDDEQQAVLDIEDANDDSSGDELDTDEEIERDTRYGRRKLCFCFLLLLS